MAKKEKGYLEIIRFDKKLKDTFIGKYLTNIRIVILLSIIILIGGISAFYILPRRLNPEVKIPIVTVSTSLPGANPEDIESLITIPLEDELNSIPKINSLTSTSSNSFSNIVLEFESTVDPDEAVDDVQTAIDSVTGLPEESTDPRVRKIDFEDQTVYTFAITSKNDLASLMTFSKSLQNSLEKLKSVDRVSTSGLEETEIKILIEPETISQFNISLLQISQSISNALNSFPAGSIKTDDNNFSITVDPEITNIKELRNLRLNIQGNIVSLSDIATIQQSPIPNQSKSYLAKDHEPKRAVIMSVFKTSSSDITKAVNDIKDHISEKTSNGQVGFEVSEILNFADRITDQFDELSSNFAITISLVFIVLFLMLGLRQAAIASFAIPLSFLVTFMVMNTMGISINFLSMFALLLSLGLLVDNTIVILSAITNYHRSKRFTPIESGLLVYKDFVAPIWATTLTTVWAFVPLLLATGIIGEFIKTIPIVVSATLIASTLIAFFIILPIMMVVLKTSIPKRVVHFVNFLVLAIITLLGIIIIPKSIVFIPTILLYIFIIFITYKVRKKLYILINNFRSKQFKIYEKKLIDISDHGLIKFELVANKYNKVLQKIIESKTARRKTIIAVIIFSLFSYLLIPLGLIKNELFPSESGDQFFITVDFPPGTNKDILEQESIELLSVIQEHPDIKSVSSQIGTGSTQQSRFNIGGGDIFLTASLVSEKKRKSNSMEIASDLRDAFSSYNKGEFSVIEQSGGPPVGNDIVISLLGDDLNVLDDLANQISNFIEKQQGITNVKKSMEPGTGKLVFVPDVNIALEKGIGISEIGASIRNYVTGLKSDDLIINGEKIDIQLRIGEDEKTPESLERLSIQTRNGLVPLIELGKFTLKNNPSQINREDQKRVLSISASVLPGYNIPEQTNIVLEHIEALNFPEGYSLKSGGVNDENQRSVASIIQAMLLSAILILITMVVQLGSFRKALIVMLVIPLAISGVFIVFALIGVPLSFPALIGLLALFGIVVNNSIIMIHTINQNLSIGLSFKKAIVDGASSRLEPIFLSSLTTVIGLTPITLSSPLWRGLGGAIIAGLLFSGVIMLFFIPVTYYLIYSREYLKKS